MQYVGGTVDVPGLLCLPVIWNVELHALGCILLFFTTRTMSAVLSACKLSRRSNRQMVLWAALALLVGELVGDPLSNQPFTPVSQ